MLNCLIWKQSTSINNYIWTILFYLTYPPSARPDGRANKRRDHRTTNVVHPHTLGVFVTGVQTYCICHQANFLVSNFLKLGYALDSLVDHIRVNKEFLMTMDNNKKKSELSWTWRLCKLPKSQNVHLCIRREGRDESGVKIC